MASSNLLFSIPDFSRTSLILRRPKEIDVLMGRNPVPVSMPVFWPGTSPICFHKTPKDPHDLSKKDRDMHSNLFGRHVDYSQNKGRDYINLRDIRDAVILLLQCLGFVINQKKSVMTPVQEIEFLGMIVNSKERTISLLFLVGEKHRNIQWKDLNSTSSSSSFTDSCFAHRLGAVWQGMKTGGTWTQEERRMHINEPELLALKLALETFLKGQEITSLHIKMEYIVALTYFLKMGGTKNLQMVCLSKQIWKLLLSKKLTDSRVPSQSCGTPY